MRVYRFGIKFKSLKELATVLDLSPYSGKGALMPSGKRASAFLSEKDIINRMIKFSDAKSEEEAKDRFIKLVFSTYPDKFTNNEGADNELKPSDAHISAGV